MYLCSCHPDSSHHDVWVASILISCDSGTELGKDGRCWYCGQEDQGPNLGRWVP